MTANLYERYRALLKSGAIGGDPAQARAADALDRLAQVLADYQPFGTTFWHRFSRGKPAPRGIYLHGDVGRGKSMLMDLFFGSVPLHRKRRIHFNAFMQETHQRIFEWRKLSLREKSARPEFVKEAGEDPIPPIAKRIRNEAWVLCFDEFQVTDVADAMILGRLFENMLAFGVVIVLTTNTEPDRLYEGGLNRQLFLPFIGEIKKRMDIVHLDSDKDYRINDASDIPVYLMPLGENTEREMNGIWQKLTGHEKGSPVTFGVLGRNFTVPQAIDGVARFTFDELCGKPHGTADYLALADRFHTLMIDNIPRLREEHRNEARRFTLLIDTIYDDGITLICSAEAPPNELCTMGDSAEAFRRTASRLIEMQTSAYLQAAKHEKTTWKKTV